MASSQRRRTRSAIAALAIGLFVAIAVSCKETELPASVATGPLPGPSAAPGPTPSTTSTVPKVDPPCNCGPSQTCRDGTCVDDGVDGGSCDSGACGSTSPCAPTLTRALAWHGTGDLRFTTPAKNTFLHQAFEGPDGMIVAVGGAGSDSMLVRFDANGAPDPSFGTNGRVDDDLQPAESDFLIAASPQGAAGDFLVLGQRMLPPPASLLQPFVARFSKTGARVTSFGTGGVVTSSALTASTYPRGLAVAPDGSFAVLAFQQSGSAGLTLIVLRYNADGSPRISFDGDGLLVVAAPGGMQAMPRAFGFASDGSLVVAASDEAPTANASMLVYKILDTGAFAPGFGAGGLVKIGLEATDATPTVLHTKVTDRIYVGGPAAPANGESGAALACLDLATGAGCPSFGAAGKMMVTGTTYTALTGLLPVRAAPRHDAGANEPPNMIVLSGNTSLGPSASNAVLVAIPDLGAARAAASPARTVTIDSAARDVSTFLLPRSEAGDAGVTTRAMLLFVSTGTGAATDATTFAIDLGVPSSCESSW